MAPLALGLMLSASVVPMAGAFVANPAAISIVTRAMGGLGGERFAATPSQCLRERR